MKPVRFHLAARAEAVEAAIFYERQQEGLGTRFADSLAAAVERIRSNPELYRIAERDTRKCRLPGFPYGVIFRVKDDSIQIVAVMHLHRRPGYWSARGQGLSET
jgi:plasmid stabilization system protein ParE